MQDVIQQEFFMQSNFSLVKSRIIGTNLTNLATIIGVLIAIVVYAAINIEESKIFKTLEKLTKSIILLRAIVLGILLVTLPIITSVTLLALLYKVLSLLIIKKSDKGFIAFLDGFDVFWSLEDDGTTRSVINVLGIIESDSADILVDRIKKKLGDVICNKSCGKIFYRRREKYGWYYWRENDNIDLDEYVKIVNVENNIDEITKKDLEGVMTKLSYQPLPFNDEGLFQIIVTKHRIGKCKTERGDYGIVFRIHHAVGDGVALIEFLCKTLADEVEDDRANIFFMPGSYSPNKRSTSFLDIIKLICSMPICFVDGILRKPDDHSLHGPSLRGKKVFKWTDSEENLYHMIKDIKQHYPDLNFSDVLATSLSSGLRNFFAKTMDHIPDDVAVILPVRLPYVSKTGLNKELKLKNNFTITILDLPTKEKRPIKEIRRRCDLVRKSVDPLVNHFFLKVCYLLPRQILQPLFKSSQATLVFSNMPGPDSISICGGSSIKSLVFFVPNKGTTGLGVSALCYDGVLRLSAMADASVVPTSDHLSLILDAMVDEIKQMHAVYVK